MRSGLLRTPVGTSFTKGALAAFLREEARHFEKLAKEREESTGEAARLERGRGMP